MTQEESHMGIRIHSMKGVRKNLKSVKKKNDLPRPEADGDRDLRTHVFLDWSIMDGVRTGIRLRLPLLL